MDAWSVYIGAVAASTVWAWLWWTERRRVELWRGRHACLSRLLEETAAIKRKHVTCATRKPEPANVDTTADILVLDDMGEYTLAESWISVTCGEPLRWQ